MEAKGLQVLSILSLLLETSTSHFLVSRTLPVEDDDDRGGLDVFREGPRSNRDSANVRIGLRPTKKFPSTSLNLDLDDPNFDDVPDLVPDARSGAGLGSACSHDGQCNGAFGFTCLRSQAAMSVCACSSLTPIHINDGGQGRCVRGTH
ncbi:hypothetical protein HPB47_008286 [Ixodes persulcatus]|uniref:Uncharacterized protein n=1 Tax=Ixodes persulcatus TaxID=34615 RepID=A0AC60P582_IXOPE|nr:hypothetical protein HPB47_008286 [Ixodes persulcatus]